jgi:2-methylcitrate dehydratase PrpD
MTDTLTRATTSGSTLLETLGGRTASLTVDQIDENGHLLIRTALVDTLGVALAGASFEGAAIMRAVSIPDHWTGPSLVLGTSDRLSALDAGMLNGIAAHALDYDDNNIVIVGHPSTILVPAVLALGEEVDATAEDVAVAYAAGYEVMIRLARGMNTAHYEKGWHPTATFGVFGAAASAAKLLGLDTEQTTAALAISASLASGIKANFGTMVKALHVGQAVRNGLLAAKLAAGGHTANPAALEAVQGFLNVYNGADNYDATAITAGLNGPLEVNIGSNPIKAYPCCGSTHAAVYSTIGLRKTHALRGADVEKIDVVVDANRMPHTDRPHLQEALSGKFSLQYVVSRALLDGRVGLEHFEGDAHHDPAVVALMERVHVSPAPPGGVANSFAADVTVTTTAGEEFHASKDPTGEIFAPQGEPSGLWDKFTDCAGQVLPAEQVTEIVTVLRAFPGPDGARRLMALVEVPARKATVTS